MRRSKYTYFLWLCFLGYGFSLSAKPVEKPSLVVQQKEQVVRLYERKRYAKANEQIEALLPLLTSRTERSIFQFYQAYCHYYEKHYLISADQFHLFVKQYPSSPQVEEAVFMRGYSLACENVDIRLDQTAAYDAMRYLEHYLAAYPAGVYLDKATHALQNLQERLMKKDFEAAHLYVRLGYYSAAIVALKNFEQAYPDSFLREKVLRLLIKSYEKLAIATSNKEKKQEMMSHVARFALALKRYLNPSETDEQPVTKKPTGRADLF